MSEISETDWMTGATLPWTVQRVTDEGSAPEQIRIVLEEPLIIEINDERAAVLMRLPGWEKELAVGFCVSEGLIANVEAIQLVHHCGRGLPAPEAPRQHIARDEDSARASRNRVQIRVAAGAYRRAEAPDVVRLVRSGCGAVGVEVGDLDLPAVASRVQVSAQVLLSYNAALRKRQELFHDVGGVHAAAIFDASGQLVAIQEDIGRHNAVDKIIGYCLLRRIPVHDKAILTTGRTSYEMVSKAVRVGIPIVASVSTPTALAVQIAEVYNCTLIGYMRANRFSIYTHPWRVLSE